MATTRIYYLGGIPAIEPGTETANFITSGQEAFTCPPIGEFMEVADYIANDIMNKYGFDVFNTNASLAKSVREGKVKFDRSSENGKMVVREVMSDEEILKRADEIRARTAEKSAINVKEDSGEDLVKEESESEKESKPTTKRRTKEKVKE